MDELASLCQEKLETFRIKELKDVLTRIGTAKQGKRQVLIEKIMAVMLSPERQQFGSRGSRPESSTKYASSREEVAKVIDDIYRKMRGSSALDLATAGDVLAGSKTSAQLSKFEGSFKRGEARTRCPCGNKMNSENMIQCDDTKCMVWQHVNCVIIPEKEGSKSEPPSQFYCELCRIQLGDPYCVAVSDLLLPTKMVTSIPGSEGSNPLQNVEKSFVLSRSDQDMLRKPFYDLQIWSVLLNDKVAFRMHWPLHTELRVNGSPVRIANRPGHQSLGINGRDDGAGIAAYVREGSNSISMSASDGRPFCVGIRMIQRLTVDQVLSRIPSEAEGEPFDTALARVRRCIGGGSGEVDNGNGNGNGNDSDSDVEVISECVFVNLRCPMSGSRMKVTGRFRRCVHMGGFDLQTFVELNQRTRKWQCPICLTNYSLDDLIIDPFLTRIVKAMECYAEDVTEVEMKPDGLWRPKLEGDSKLQEPWRSPEGSFGLANGEKRHTSNQGALKAVKIEEGFPLEQVPLKIGIKRTRDGTWQVKQTKVLPSLLSNGIHEQNSVLARGDYSRSSSMTVNTTEVPSSRHEPEEMLQLSKMADVEVSSIPTEVSVSLFGPIRSVIADSEPIRNAEVIILSDTEEENLDECDLVDQSAARLRMGQSAVPLQNEAQDNERDLETDNSFLEMEPFQENTMDFFEADTGESTPALNPWSPQPHNLPFEVLGSATNILRTGTSHQRTARSTSMQTGQRSTHGFSNEQYRQNGMSETRLFGYDRSTEYQGELLENARGLASTDPSLHLFLPQQPARALVRHGIHEPVVTPREDIQDGWFSLSLGGGDRMTESHSNIRAPSYSSEQASQERFDPVTDPASVLLNLSSQGTPAATGGTTAQRRTASVAVHRSTHRSRSYFRVDSDSDDD